MYVCECMFTCMHTCVCLCVLVGTYVYVYTRACMYCCWPMKPVEITTQHGRSAVVSHPATCIPSSAQVM